MATTHLNKSVIAGGSINTIKSLKKYWNSPVSDVDDNSSEAKYTMLQMAILLNKKKIVEYLIPQKDLDLTTRATDGTTALMTAVEKDVPLDWIRAMLERGADKNINVEDNEGRMAIDRCEKGSAVYDLLVRYGAQPKPSPPPTPPPEPEADKAADASTMDNNAAGDGVAAAFKPVPCLMGPCYAQAIDVAWNISDFFGLHFLINQHIRRQVIVMRDCMWLRAVEPV